jgi:hypothetical protein
MVHLVAFDHGVVTDQIFMVSTGLLLAGVKTSGAVAPWERFLGASVMAGVGQVAVIYSLKWRFIVAAPSWCPITHSLSRRRYGAFEFISVHLS